MTGMIRPLGIGIQTALQETQPDSSVIAVWHLNRACSVGGSSLEARK